MLITPKFFFIQKMVHNYKKKETGGQTNFSINRSMTDTYNAVMSENMSNKAAAKFFGVNKKSQLRWTARKIPINACVGRQTVLSPVYKTELADCIKLMSEWG